MTTTLRLSRTNEVSTVDNNAIANCRITNHARSPHAHVNLSLKFLCTTTTQQLDSFLSKEMESRLCLDNPVMMGSEDTKHKD